MSRKGICVLQKRWDSVAEQRTPSVGPALPWSSKEAILDMHKSRIDSSVPGST